MNKSILSQVPAALIVLGCSMLAYAIFNTPILSLLGFSVATISIGIALMCYAMWTKTVDVEYHKREEYISEIAFTCNTGPSKLKFWYKWKLHACAQFPQFWAMFIWIMYCGFISCVSMYVETLPAPCEIRNDCQATQSRGIYTGETK